MTMSEDYYENTFLGYLPGENPTIGAFLTGHLARCGEEAVVGNRRSSQQKTVLKTLNENVLMTRVTNAKTQPTVVQERTVASPVQRLLKKRSGGWLRGAKPLPQLRNPHFFSTATRLTAASTLDYPEPSWPRDRSPYDVFLSSPHAPFLGRRPAERPADYLLSPRQIRKQEMMVQDIVLGTSAKLKSSVAGQLEAFETKHKLILQKPAQSDKMDIRVLNVLKSSKVQQVLHLRQSPVPALFKNVPPRRLQELYASVVGSLQEEMTAPAFHGLTTLLRRPEPPLGEEAALAMFSAIDTNHSGSVNFVEFISTLVTLTASVAVRETFKKLLFHMKEADGCVGRSALSAVRVEEVVRKLKLGGNDPQQYRDDFNMQKELMAWRSTAADIEAASSTLGASARLKKEEFAVLLYLDEKVMRGIIAAPL